MALNPCMLEMPGQPGVQPSSLIIATPNCHDSHTTIAGHEVIRDYIKAVKAAQAQGAPIPPPNR